MNAWDTISSVTLVWAYQKDTTKDWTTFIGSLANIDLFIKASLALINCTIFPSQSFNAGVVPNRKGFVYLRVFQQYILSTTRPDNWYFSYKNFCKHSFFVFLIVPKYSYWACFHSSFWSLFLPSFFMSFI